MSAREPYDDELARRRALKHREGEPGEGPEQDDLPKLGWKDVLALTIAAYQVVFPMLLVMIGVMVVVYLMFRFLFH